MSEVYYFQRYYTKENAHSSNALLLLKRVYFYSPKIFYKVLSNWLDCDENKFLPSFIAQEKGNNSVPDFCIRQNGFELIVEAKEKNNAFSENQIKRHLNSFQSISDVKIFIALAPAFSESDRKKFDSINSINVNVIAINYLDLYESIKNVCDDRHDSELIELLEEYREYCNEENLIDDTDNTIMVRSVGDTIDFNVKEENRLYYDKFEHRYEGFRYLALYNSKSIKYIGKIYKVIKAYKKENGEVIMDGLVPHIIATHSLEIISRVDPDNILEINKKDKTMHYATDSLSAQKIIDDIGGVQNLALLKLGRTRKCLFVEGKDLKYLNHFNEILYGNQLYIPTIPFGGFNNIPRVYGTSNLFYSETTNQIRAI